MKMEEKEWPIPCRKGEVPIWNNPAVIESGSRYALIPVCYSGNIIVFDTAKEALIARQQTKQFRCGDPLCTHQLILDLFKIN